MMKNSEKQRKNSGRPAVLCVAEPPLTEDFRREREAAG
jgi:hypothetical protein